MLAHNPAQNYDARPEMELQPKHPTSFMFIDSSHGGINAKPDKTVRSFVMKSARTKKTWSTRPKSVKKDSPPDPKPKRQLSTQTHALNTIVEDPLRFIGKHTSTDGWCTMSPRSAYSDSVMSNSGSDCMYSQSISDSTTPGTEYAHIDCSCTLLAPQQEMSVPVTSLMGSFEFDSFECLPVQLDRRSQGLLHQFLMTAAPRVIPIDQRETSGSAAMQWIKGCIQSPFGAPFIYAVLTSSARAAQLDSEKYKWLAMSAVNALLSNPRTSTNDSTISAVLVLLAMEEADLADPRRQGDERECSLAVNDAHHNGLKTMIRQRGGLAALCGNRMLQVCLLMHSIAQAITTFKLPYAVLVDTNGQVEDYAIIASQAPSNFAHILRHFRVLNLDRSLLKIIFAITIFVADLTRWYDIGSCSVDSLDLQKHASLLMYRLFEWYKHSEEDCMGCHTATVAVNQSVCLALLIFMVNATEPNSGPFGSRLSKTVARLRHSLRAATSTLWSSAPNVLLWVSTMGALGAKGLPKFNHAAANEQSLAFFEDYIRASIGDFWDYNTPVEHLLDRMRSCLWIPSVFDERATILWTLMGLCETSLPELEDASSSEGEHVEDEYALGQSTTLRFFTADKRRN